MSNSTSSDGVPTKGVRWHYDPSLAGNAVFAFIFGVLTIIHLYKLIRTKKWFCVPFVIGAVFEEIGYASRAYCHSSSTAKANTRANGPFIAQTILLLLAPILFAASIYMVLGRIIRGCNAAQYSLLRLTRLTKTFVIGDCACFLIQAFGGGSLAGAKTKKQYDTFNDVVLAGLVLQIAFFAGFLIVATTFHRRLNRRETVEATKLPWKRLMYMLYVSSALITLRNIYRVIEYAQGQNGWLYVREWPLFVFDGICMIFVAFIGIWWYGSGLQSAPSKRKTKGAATPGALEQSHPADETVELNQKPAYTANQPWS